MRGIVCFLFSVFCFLSSSAQSTWDAANEAYIAGSYGEAIARYDTILEGGQASAKLYYNLAGAHFKLGHLGKSILYYHKAQRLAPTDRDIAHNLAVAEAMVKDRIEPLPRFFALRWIDTLRHGLSSNGWALWALLMLALGGAATLLFLLSTRMALRKAGFWSACCCVLLMVVGVSFAVTNHRQATHPREGIVMRMNVSIRSSPDNAGKELYIINEGTQVRVTGKLQQWREVELQDGKKGWIDASAIEMI